jgi:hypothetical protein
MIIATSGSSYINYNQIFHSSSPSTTPPYSVNTINTKTLRDNTLSIDYELYALYIIDKDHAVSLIWHYDNLYS